MPESYVLVKYIYAKIHGAFAYYYENQTKLYAEIRQRLSTAERVTDEMARPALR